MIEFGSDFHYVTGYKTSINYFKLIEENNFLLFANGRHAINSVLSHGILKYNWKRIWIPEYFCYTVIESIQLTGIQVHLYFDYPSADDISEINKIPFKDGDVLLRMNYFGLRALRCNKNIPVPVIEDHSHDLFSLWATRSNADYCIASLRKTIPIPEGGIAWSPKNKEIDSYPSDVINDLISYKKLAAMLLKKEYLDNKQTSKELFRKIFLDSEKQIDSLTKISGISSICSDLLYNFDARRFYSRKKENWIYLFEALKNHLHILTPELISNGTPFSLILKFDKMLLRDNFKKKLLKQNVYPAILWPIPEKKTPFISEIGNTTISIHCDGRYSLKQIEQLAQILKSL